MESHGFISVFQSRVNETASNEAAEIMEGLNMFKRICQSQVSVCLSYPKLHGSCTAPASLTTRVWFRDVCHHYVVIFIMIG